MKIISYEMYYNFDALFLALVHIPLLLIYLLNLECIDYCPAPRETIYIYIYAQSPDLFSNP